MSYGLILLRILLYFLEGKDTIARNYDQLIAYDKHVRYLIFPSRCLYHTGLF
jgi:hypothetical protein